MAVAPSWFDFGASLPAVFAGSVKRLGYDPIGASVSGDVGRPAGLGQAGSAPEPDRGGR